jgi:hypothetical protein
MGLAVAPDFALLAAKARAGVRRRAYWQVRYRDGTVVSEWERDWLDLPRTGLVACRLVCPNGRVGEVGNGVDASDRLFQFKVARAAAGLGRATVAHVIGILNAPDGACTLFAWEPEGGSDGRGILRGPLRDNWHALAYGDGTIRGLSAAVLGARPD